MANKEAVFTVTVNTGNSVQDLQNADKAVQQLGQDLQKTQDVAKNSSGTDAMAQKLAELDARLEAGGLSMREMTKTMKEYQTIALQAGVESPVGMQALQNASALKDEIGDLKAQTTALSSDFVGLDTTLAGVEVGAQAFAGVTSAMALTGVENENLMKSMQKLQAVQGLTNSISTIANKLNSDSILGIQLRTYWEKLKNSAFVQGTSATTANTTATVAQTTATTASATATATLTGGMKLFRLALASTGIGLLVVALGALVANFGVVVKAIQPVIDGFKAIGDFLGLSDFAGEEAHENEMARLEAEKQAREELAQAREAQFNASQKQYDREIALMDAQGKDTKALTKLKIEESIKYQKEKLKEIELEIRASEETVRLSKMIVGSESESVKRFEDIKKQRVELTEGIKDAENQLLINEINNAKKSEDQAKENAKKASEAYKKRKEAQKKEAEETKKAHDKYLEQLKKHNEDLLKEEEAIDEMIRRSKMSARDLELSDIQDEYFAKKTQAEKLGAEGAELLVKLTAEEELKKAEVRKKYADAELKAQADRETKRRERQKFLDEINLNDQEKALKDVSEKFDESKKELLRRLNSTNEDERITQEEFNNAMIALEQKKADKILEINKQASEKSKEQQKKDREESLKGVTDFLANSQMVLDHVKTVNNLINEIDQARLNSLNKNRDEDLANLDAKMQAELNAEGVTAEQKKQIEEKFAQQKYQVQLQAFNAEEKIRKQQFIRDKAIKLSQIAIDTASAIVKAIAQYGPPPSPMGIAGIASASIIGITQALAVANQQYKSGSAPSAPNISTGGGAMTGASASSFSSSPTSTTSTAGLTEQGTPTPTTTSTQVYVLESDISATQNKVKLQEAKTSF